MRKNIILMITCITLLTTFKTFAEDVAKGEKLYNGLCLPCHGIDKKIVGPALGNIQKTRTIEWLTSFIKNSTEFAKTDTDAAAIIKEYNGMMMSPFPQLSNTDIKDMLAYIASKSVDISATATNASSLSNALVPATNIEAIQAANQRGLMWSVTFGCVALFIITWVLVERIKLANYPTK
ncbi:MAG: c-type cytochrome [Chitinophagaceae bacterium]